MQSMKIFFVIISLLYCSEIFALIKEFSGIQLPSVIETEKKKNTKTYYAHKKFCKILNFSLAKEIKDSYTEIKILLFYNGNQDFTLKKKDKGLQSSSQFHIRIKENNKVYEPITIEEIQPTIEEEILFGREYIRFGNLFKITFKELIQKESELELFQPNRSIIARI
jgi:hypothetical protein